MPLGRLSKRMRNDSKHQSAEDQIRDVYVQRSRSSHAAYDPLTRAGRWLRLEAQRILWTELASAIGSEAVFESEFLDVGCGTGDWLRGLSALGVPDVRLHGIDLQPERIA